MPLSSPDFAPPLQRMADLKPDSAFIYFPGPLAPVFTRQFAEKGLGQTGIKIFGPGDLCDDDSLDNAGDQMIGLITAGYYTAAHDSPLNKQYQADFTKLNGPLRGDFTSLGAYDGLHLIYEALKKTGGDADGDKIIAAVKGMAFESPRGPISVRRGDARHRLQHLHAQGREDRRAPVGQGVRDLPERQGPAEELTLRPPRGTSTCR